MLTMLEFADGIHARSLQAGFQYFTTDGLLGTVANQTETKSKLFKGRLVDMSKYRRLGEGVF